MLHLIYLLLCIPVLCGGEINEIDEELSNFLYTVDQKLAELFSKETHACWFIAVNGNDTESAINQTVIETETINQYILSIRPTIAKFKRLNIEDPYLKRKLNLIPDFGIGILGQDDLNKMNNAVLQMTMMNTYVKMDFQSSCVAGEINPLENAESLKICWLKSTDYVKNSIYVDWKVWLDLYKKTANLHGFSRTADYELREFGMNADEVLELMEKFLAELKPIYVQFQAHLRHKLRSKLGSDILPHNEPIPFHLYDAFVQSTWDTIETPYAETTNPNITLGLIKRGLNNAKRTFLNVAEFYRSLGFPQLPHDFFQLNARPTADIDNCDHKLWNFFGQQPLQITYCPKINEERFFKMFDLVSEVYFFNSVQTLSPVYQQEPLGHFCEAIAKFFEFIANSPGYLEQLKLIDEGLQTKDQKLNNLYKMGFRELLPLPMLYIIQNIRSKVIDSKKYSNQNCLYWQLVEDYLGVSPPLQRSNEDFDIAEKLFIDGADELASTFMSIVFKFQLIKYFCEQTGQFGKDEPLRTLDMCNLIDQRIIGPVIIEAMSLGATVSYRDVLQQITGETEFNIDGLIAYFKPLYEWLEEQNKNDRVEIGWNKVKMCT